jgi:dTDP-4-dehydrorhamnose reductase
MKVAIFGVGFLGRKLMEFFSPQLEVVGADINPSDALVEKIDATDVNEIEDFLTVEKPDIVIDTIALSSYFVCENNPELCKSLNYETAKNIAAVCRKINAKMVFISSSYVFDGEKGNYSEADATSPTNEYARSKILAEKTVLDLENSIVIRTEPLYGFNNQINQLMAGTTTFENDLENGYPETLRNPVYINDLPGIILSLIEKDQTGIFHIAGQGKMKWIDFLRKLASLVNAEDKVITVDNSGWILEPPHDSSLATSKIESLGIKTTSFETALKQLPEQCSSNPNS